MYTRTVRTVNHDVNNTRNSHLEVCFCVTRRSFRPTKSGFRRSFRPTKSGFRRSFRPTKSGFRRSFRPTKSGFRKYTSHKNNCRAK